MSLMINREIFERVKAVIAQTGRINMVCWAENQDGTALESVDEIRELPLLDDCQMMACIGGLVCYLATPDEITRASGIYDLSDNEVQEPSLLGAALLLDDAEDKYELENACLPLLSLLHWPMDEQVAYNASKTDVDRNQVVLRRMDNWAAEIESRQSAEI
ncbi:MAG: hypothetical protein MOB07_00890 [Acidobacteria bacterium]|nr:hypothetical protein [Acidobacteriota bacterium]